MHPGERYAIKESTADGPQHAPVTALGFWRVRLLDVLGSLWNAALGAVAATAVAALVAWLSGAPVRVLALLGAVGLVAAILSGYHTVRRRVSINAAIRQYLAAPSLGPSQFLPVGPSALGTPVGTILTKQDLLVPQRWQHLTHPARSGVGDLATAAGAVADSGGRVLIVGEPGIGKSLTASRAFLSLARGYLDSRGRRPIPVFVHLSDVDLTGTRPAIGIVEVVASLMGVSARVVRRWVSTGGLVTVLDGFDETAGLAGAASVRAALSSTGFGTGRIVAARRDFFDLYASMPEMVGRFALSAELERLPFDATIGAFVHAYCAEFQHGEPDAVMAAIARAPELRDLASRPLTLWMVVDVLVDPPTDTSSRDWTMTELYSRYTTKWLEREAGRPGSRVERTEDKRSLVRLATRAMFQGGTAVGGALRSTTEMAVSRDQLAEALRASPSGALVADVVHRLGLDVTLDELCLRTFLVRGGAEEGYRFAHKSFFEYFVALDMWECTGREARLDIAEQYFARPLSDPVVYFFREMLSQSRTRADQQRLFCQNMTTLLKRLRNSTQPEAETVRQHVGNLLAGVADEPTAAFLASFAEQELSQFVRRGIIVGLALHHGRTDLLNAYVHQLRDEDKAGRRAVTIQIGYSRIYHGDQVWDGRWEDDGTAEVSRTVDAQIDRLLTNRNRHLNQRIWLLTLFTLRKLIEDGRGRPALEHDLHRKEQLVHFLRQQRLDHGDLFEDERQRLLTLMTDQ